jgi:hypothetical protein
VASVNLADDVALRAREYYRQALGGADRGPASVRSSTSTPAPSGPRRALVSAPTSCVTIPRGVNKWCHRVRACLWALALEAAAAGLAKV